MDVEHAVAVVFDAQHLHFSQRWGLFRLRRGGVLGFLHLLGIVHSNAHCVAEHVATRMAALECADLPDRPAKCGDGRNGRNDAQDHTTRRCLAHHGIFPFSFVFLTRSIPYSGS